MTKDLQEHQPLTSLEREMQHCEKCDLCQQRTSVVFGEGNPDNPILMILGEAPGKNEDVEGRPFVGQCGEKLDKMLAYAGLEREEVYITNAVLCRPPNNRNPLMKEIEACRPRLLHQIKKVNPDILVVMGRMAMQALQGAPLKGALSKLFNVRFHEMKVDDRPGKYVVTYHPSYLLRNRKVAFPIMFQHWTDIKDEVERIKESRKD